MKTPWRLHIARLLCRPLPPLISQRLRMVLYPQKLAFRDRYTFLTRSQTGSLFEAYTRDFHAYPFAVHGYYEWRNWAVALAACSSGDTIVEVGANIGTETVGFRDIVGPKGKVFAFEPMPENVSALKDLIELNQWSNVFIYPIALGSEHVKADFVLPEQDWASGIGYLTRSSTVAKNERIKVQVKPLDSMKSEISSVQAIFTDTEGAEVEVLTGAKEIISRDRPIIILEASPKLLARAGKSMTDLQALFAELQYISWEIGRWGLTKPSKFKRGSASNWVCLPDEKIHLVSRLERYILLSGMLPCIPGLNPMTRRA